MPRSGAQKLGRKLGDMDKRISELEDNQGPVESGANLLLNSNRFLELTAKINVTKLELCSDAFVLDHPTQGVLDDPNLKLDKAYCAFTDVQNEISYDYLATDNSDTALFAGQGVVIDYNG